MQKVKIPKRVGRQLYRSSPTILTVVASVGVIVTTITAVRATPKAIKLLKEAEAEKGENLNQSGNYPEMLDRLIFLLRYLEFQPLSAYLEQTR